MDSTKALVTYLLMDIKNFKGKNMLPAAALKQ